MRIYVHLAGGEVVEFSGDPDEWLAAFSKALRRPQGVEVKDFDHEGRLGFNPHNVLYWKSLRAPVEDDYELSNGREAD